MKNFYRLIQGDCFRVLPIMINKQSIDLVIIDPPYSLYHSAKREASLGDFIVFESYHRRLMPLIKEVTHKKSHLFVFCDFRTYPATFYGMYEYFKPVNLIVWQKDYLGPGNNFRPFHELIIYSRGSESYNPKNRSITDIWKANRVKNGYCPFQKPEKLIKIMIENCSEIGDVVLDPFLGSGTTMKVAQDLGRSCIGIEINPDCCEIVKKRCFGRQFLDREVEYSFEVFE